MNHARRKVAPFRPAPRARVCLAALCAIGAVAPALAVDRIEIPGGREAISRLLGHVDTDESRFASSLNRSLLRSVPRDHEGPLSPDRRLVVGYLAEVRALRDRLRPPVELTLDESDRFPQAFLELAEYFGYILREGSWVAPLRSDPGLELKRQVAAALDLDVGAIAYRLERGEAVRIDIPLDRAAAPMPFAQWRTLSGGEIQTENGLDALIADSRLGLMLEGLRRADPGLAGLLGEDGLRRLYLEGSLPFYRYATSIRLERDRLVLPGGTAAAPVWRRLVGASTDKPREFVLQLLRDEDPRAAHLWHALTFAPPRVREILLADDRRGAALREPLEAYADRIFGAEQADLLSSATGGDYSVTSLLRSLPLGEAEADANRPAWLEHRGLQQPCMDEKRVRRIAGKLKSRDVSDPRFLEHLLADSTPLHGSLGLLFQPYLEVKELFRERAELLTPTGVLLLRRAAAYRPLVLSALRDLPFTSAEQLDEFLLTAEELDCLEPGERRDAESLTFQGGVQLVSALVRGGRLAGSAGAARNAEWVALHRTPAEGPASRTTTRRLDWLEATVSALPSAPADAAGRGPLEQRLLAALVGSDAVQSFRAQGLPYRGRRGRDLAAAMAGYLGSQSVAAVDRLVAIREALGAAEKAAGERDGLRIRLAIRQVETLVAPLSIPAEARVAGLESPEFAHAVEHRRRLLELIEAEWRGPGELREATVSRMLLTVAELLDRELRSLFCSLPYLRPIALLADRRFDQPLFVLRHTIAREVDPHSVAPEVFPTAWSETAVVPAAFAPAGSHLAGSLVHVLRALTRHHALLIAPERRAHTWINVRPWWITALESNWAATGRDSFRLAAELMHAGDALIEAATADRAALEGSLVEALEQRIPPRRFEEARDSGARRPLVGPGDRLQAGLALLDHDTELPQLHDLRQQLLARLKPGGKAAREALREIGVATPRLNGALRPRIGEWPPYEAVEREASVAALRERQFVDVWLTVVEWLADRDLPPRVGYDVMLRVLEDIPGKVRLESQRDWESLLDFVATMDPPYFEGRLRACLIRGLYSAESLR